MDAVILTMLGLMGSWNIAITIWILKPKRNNPHPPIYDEHGRTLKRLEVAIESARKEANEAHRLIHEDLGNVQQIVGVLWNEAHPGQPMPWR